MKYPSYKPSAPLQINDGNGLGEWFDAQHSQGDLLDVNVWIALVDTRHIHHQAALTYWQGIQTSSTRAWMCRATMLGLVRVLAQLKHGGKSILSARDALEICNNYLAMPFVSWLPETAQRTKLLSSELLQVMQEIPTHMCTDAYLAALSKVSGLRMVTFDADFKRFELENWLLLCA